MVDGDPTPSSSDETVEGTIEGAEDRIQFLKWWEVSEREGERERERDNCLP
jgi:flavin-binding protein dodecin